MGFRGKVGSAFKTYLLNQKQQAHVGETFSERGNCKLWGVTGNGPWTVLYVNDLMNQETMGTILSYVDEAAIFYMVPTWKILLLLI